MNSSEMRFDGQVSIVTGAGGPEPNLGRSFAMLLAARGAKVVVNDLGVGADGRGGLYKASAEAVTKEIRSAGGEAVADTQDVGDPASAKAIVQSAIDTWGRIDILVNNAVARFASPVEQFPVGEWDLGIAVNISAAFHTIRLALPGMRLRNWGRIINVSSIYGLIGGVNRISYVTSKTALIGMTRAVALETRGHDITCNAVCPGTVETPVHIKTVEQMMAAESLSRAEAEQRFLANKQPGGRFISAEDVAGMLLFLCGPESRDITGAALPIDGGWSIA